MGERFVFPPRPELRIQFKDIGLYDKPNFRFEFKHNDSRTIIWFREGKSFEEVEFWNRHGQLLAYRPPGFLVGEVVEVARRLGFVEGEWNVLDAGLLHSKHECPTLKDRFVLFDVLVRGKPLIGSTYRERHGWLEGLCCESLGDHGALVLPESGVRLGQLVSSRIHVCSCYGFGDLQWMWEAVGVANKPWVSRPGRENSCVLEGVVGKDVGAALGPMNVLKNNMGWMMKSRVSTGRHAF